MLFLCTSVDSLYEVRPGISIISWGLCSTQLVICSKLYTDITPFKKLLLVAGALNTLLGILLGIWYVPERLDRLLLLTLGSLGSIAVETWPILLTLFCLNILARGIIWAAYLFLYRLSVEKRWFIWVSAVVCCTPTITIILLGILIATRGTEESYGSFVLSAWVNLYVHVTHAAADLMQMLLCLSSAIAIRVPCRRLFKRGEQDHMSFCCVGNNGFVTV